MSHALNLVVRTTLMPLAFQQKTVEAKPDGKEQGTVVVIGTGRTQHGGCNRRTHGPSHNGACASPDPRDFFPDDKAPDAVPAIPGKTAA